MIYQPVIQRFLQKYGLQYADAMEVSQEVLGAVVKSIDRWDSSQQNSTFRGWLYRVTRNKAVNFLRQKKSLLAGNSGLSQVADRTAGDPNALHAAFHQEFERQLFQCAAGKVRPKVKVTNWTAFWNSTIEGHSIERVARELGVEQSAVYVARCRIMKQISQLIQDRLDDSSQFPIRAEL